MGVSQDKGYLILGILLFRVLYEGPLFSENDLPGFAFVNP